MNLDSLSLSLKELPPLQDSIEWITNLVHFGEIDFRSTQGFEGCDNQPFKHRV